MGKFIFSPTLLYRMSTVTLDERGRVTIPKSLREEYGDRYWIVEGPGGIRLIPIAADPLDALRDEFEDVDASAEQLREEARADAVDKAGR